MSTYKCELLLTDDLVLHYDVFPHALEYICISICTKELCNLGQISSFQRNHEVIKRRDHYTQIINSAKVHAHPIDKVKLIPVLHLSLETLYQPLKAINLITTITSSFPLDIFIYLL